MIEIKQENQIFFDVVWTIQASEKSKSLREELKYLSVERGFEFTKFTCTNGSVLHQVTIENDKILVSDDSGRDIFNGLYRIVALTKDSLVLDANKDEKIIFPDYKKIIPDTESAFYQEMALMPGSSDKNLSVEFFRICKRLNGAFSFKQFTASISGRAWSAFIPMKNTNGLVFKSTGCFCLIMPLIVHND